MEAAADETTVLRAGAPAMSFGRIRVAVIAPREPPMPERPWRRIDAYALVLVCGGHGRYRDPAGRRAELGAGDAIVVRPGSRHWYGPDDGGTWSEVFVIFEGPIFDLFFAAGIPGGEQPVRHVGAPEPWIERIRAAVGAPPPGTPRSALEELLRFLLLLSAVVGGETAGGGGDGDPIERGRRLLAEDATAALPLTEVAAECGLPYETFRRRFTRELGVAPGRYRDEQRVKAAQDLLRSTQMTHAAIAQVLGFADEYHFSRRFRALAGEPPREYRAGGAAIGPGRRDGGP
ncbi:MAG: helix-turn-helix transcriptional regulator [Actinobacteria bacterium]|nr:helix-turn-helix transcriptional regulator [Actinomycetota bacterium]